MLLRLVNARYYVWLDMRGMTYVRSYGPEVAHAADKGGSSFWRAHASPGGIDMRTQGKPGLWLGLLSGLFLTLPLVAIFYLGYRLAALPFPPFNLFDWQTRILPGSVLAKGINTMVRVIGWPHATEDGRTRPTPLASPNWPSSRWPSPRSSSPGW